MDKGIAMVDSITRMLTEFALTKFPVQALTVRGPVNEGSSYRWRIVSTRYQEVTVVLRTSRSLFGKLKLRAIEVFGIHPNSKVGPSLPELQAYLGSAELVAL